jgi:hypothetical protein
VAYAGLLDRALGGHFRHAALLARAIRHRRLATATMAAAGASAPLFDTLVEAGLGHARVSAGLLARIPPAWLLARLSAAAGG